MPKIDTRRRTKRYGHHQKQTPHFLKTYWPYVPLALIVSSMVVLSLGLHKIGRGVLAYATSVSASGLLTDTNQQRLANDITPLKLNSRLAAAAQAKANDMAKRNYWSHNTPDGNPPWFFFDKAGYTYQKAGENLAYGFGTSEDTVTGWMNSPPHRQNLLDPSFQEVGFGYADVPNYQSKGEETIVVAMYGASRQTPAAAVATTTSPTHSATYSTLGASTKRLPEPTPRSVAVIELLTAGRMPWLSSLIIISGFSGLLLLLVRHSLVLRRVITRGERYVLHHPLFDVTLLSFMGLCLMLSQAAGVIR